MQSEVLYTLFIALTGLERLVELAISRKNAAHSFARGGVEYGARHFPFMVALHAGLLVGCVAEVWLLHRSFIPALGWPLLVVALLCQLLRYWVITTLGHQWNTRVIVVPGARRVTGGPFRFVPHPNYVGVAIEGVVLPMLHMAWLTAIIFSVLNALLLATRIRCEEEALGKLAPTAPAPK